MSTRDSSWLAWSLAGLSVTMFVSSVALYVLARSAQVPSSLIASRTVIDLLVSAPVLAFPVVGALIVSKRPKNPIGWICLAEGFLWMFLAVIDFYGVYGLAKPGSVPFPVVVYALGQWLWVPTVGLLAVYLVLLFPDGRLPSRRWRSLAWLSAVVIVLVSVTQGLLCGVLMRWCEDLLWDHSEFVHKNQLCSSLNVKTTKARLEAAGFGEINTWLHEELTEFDSMDELASFLKTVVLGHHLERLPESEREQFAAMVAARLAQRGELVVDYVRLNFLAKREVAA
jgi:hypothetical protein